MKIPNIKHLQQVLKNATPGPWKWLREYHYSVLVGPEYDKEHPGLSKNLIMDDGSACGEYNEVISERTADGEFVQTFNPETVGWMLEIVAKYYNDGGKND